MIQIPYLRELFLVRTDFLKWCFDFQCIYLCKDIGCAYGRNVAAAVRMLGAGHVAPDPRLQVSHSVG